MCPMVRQQSEQDSRCGAFLDIGSHHIVSAHLCGSLVVAVIHSGVGWKDKRILPQAARCGNGIGCRQRQYCRRPIILASKCRRVAVAAACPRAALRGIDGKRRAVEAFRQHKRGTVDRNSAHSLAECNSDRLRAVFCKIYKRHSQTRRSIEIFASATPPHGERPV